MIYCVITTGHSGSKWLAAALRETLPDSMVHHECVITDLCPYKKEKYYGLGKFWLFDERILSIGNVPSIIEEVEENLDIDHFFIGWDSVLLLPYFIEAHKDLVKVIYLRRDASTLIKSGISDINFFGITNDIKVVRPNPLYSNILTSGVIDHPIVWQELSREGKIYWWFLEVETLVTEMKNYSSVFRLEYESILLKREENLLDFLDFINVRSEDRRDFFINFTDRKINSLRYYIDPKSSILDFGDLI